MKEARYFYVPDAESLSQLPAEEAAHAVRVLRLHEGNEFFLIDGQGAFFRAEVTLAAGKHCGYRIIEKLPQQKTWNGHLLLAMAPTEMMDRVEWMAEKATEIGVDRISFLDCQYSERRVIKTERLSKIAVAAMSPFDDQHVDLSEINQIIPAGFFTAAHSLHEDVFGT